MFTGVLCINTTPHMWWYKIFHIDVHIVDFRIWNYYVPVIFISVKSSVGMLEFTRKRIRLRTSVRQKFWFIRLDVTYIFSVNGFFTTGISLWFTKKTVFVPLCSFQSCDNQTISFYILHYSVGVFIFGHKLAF